MMTKQELLLQHLQLLLLLVSPELIELGRKQGIIALELDPLDLWVFLDELGDACLLLTLLEDAARNEDVIVSPLLETLQKLLALGLTQAMVLHQKEAIKVVLVLALFHGSLGDVCGAVDINHGDRWSRFKLRPRVLGDS